MLSFLLSFQIGQINITVINKQPPETQETHNGPTPMQNLEIADKTGKAILTIWGDQLRLFQEGSSYAVTNLKYSLFPNSSITTTTTSQITQQPMLVITPDILSIKLPTEDISTNTTEGRIIAAKVNTQHQCQLCKKLQPETFNPNKKTNHCSFCQMLQKTSNYKSITSGNTVIITPLNSQLRLSLPMQTINTYFTNNNLTHIMNNKLSIEEHFIEQEHFNITHTSSLTITALSPIHSSSKPGPSRSPDHLDEDTIKEISDIEQLITFTDSENK